MNASKIALNELPLLYGEAKRPARVIEKGQLEKETKGLGQSFNAYFITDGEIIAFPKFEDIVVKKQPVKEGSSNMCIYVSCTRTKNGNTKPSWFNVNCLHRRDINNEPLYKEFYECDNIYNRIQKLCNVGSIIGTGIQKMSFTKFGEDGHPALDEYGNRIPEEKEVNMFEVVVDEKPKAK